MKYLVCSDIHGSFEAAQKIVDFFEKESCHKLLILGDTLYHGPRNPLPKGHNPMKVAELLNQYAEKICACRGNCDAEVDQKVLHFPTMDDFFELTCSSTLKVFASHGHVYAPFNRDGKMPVNCEDAKFPDFLTTPLIQNKTIFFYGHTHISLLEKRNPDYFICNPGSPSLPKGGSQAGFALFDTDLQTISLRDTAGKILQSLQII